MSNCHVFIDKSALLSLIGENDNSPPSLVSTLSANGAGSRLSVVQTSALLRDLGRVLLGSNKPLRVAVSVRAVLVEVFSHACTLANGENGVVEVSGQLASCAWGVAECAPHLRDFLVARLRQSPVLAGCLHLIEHSLHENNNAGGGSAAAGGGGGGKKSKKSSSSSSKSLSPQEETAIRILNALQRLVAVDTRFSQLVQWEPILRLMANSNGSVASAARACAAVLAQLATNNNNNNKNDSSDSDNNNNNMDDSIGNFGVSHQLAESICALLKQQHSSSPTSSSSSASTSNDAKKKRKQEVEEQKQQQQQQPQVDKKSTTYELIPESHLPSASILISETGELVEGADASWIVGSLVPSASVVVGGVLLPRRSRDSIIINTSNNNANQQQQSTAASASSSEGVTFVETPTARENIRRVVSAMCREGSSPVLLEGVPGSGKSAVVEHLAQLTNNTDMIRIHLDDQMDSKTLLGTFVSTEVPGEFAWRAGALTQAVQQGRWVLIEDIDMAPFEIIAALVPLLESGQLLLAGRNETIRAKEGFQLFATRSLMSSDGKRITLGRDSPASAVLRDHCSRVTIDPLPVNEIGELLVSLFPPLQSQHILELLLQAFHAVCLQEGGKGVGSRSSLIGLRDLIKICGRVSCLEMGQARRNYTVEAVRESALREIIDVLIAWHPTIDLRIKSAEPIANILGIDVNKISEICRRYRPNCMYSPTPSLMVGRANLPMREGAEPLDLSKSLCMTPTASRLLESIAVSVREREPVLLTGETGTGKTFIVQKLADAVGAHLVVINMSQQSDSTDLLGGYKPMEISLLARPLLVEFLKLFKLTFSTSKNQQFLKGVQLCVEKRNWTRFVKMLRQGIQLVNALGKKSNDSNNNNDNDGEKKAAAAAGEEKEQVTTTTATTEQSKKKKKKKRSENEESNNNNNKKQSQDDSTTAGAGAGADADDDSKRRRTPAVDTLDQWKGFAARLADFEKSVRSLKGKFAFSFVEGALPQALRNGHWLLLDEVNLAPADVLQRLAGLLDGRTGTLVLTERGDVEAVPRHDGFRLFCCMNPPTDVGKKNLPAPLRARFTEFFVDELTSLEELSEVVRHYLGAMGPQGDATTEIVHLYLGARKAPVFDGGNGRVHYNLRTLVRMLELVRHLLASGVQLRMALTEGAFMSFFTQLDPQCRPIMGNLIKIMEQRVGGGGGAGGAGADGGNTKVIGAKLGGSSLGKGSGGALGSGVALGTANVKKSWHWLLGEKLPGTPPSHFILTPSVEENLRHISRAIVTGKYNVLLQGPTSAGKTSSVEYVAACMGNSCVRINNHAHTDVHEYIGGYVTDNRGQLVFQEGPLVQAVRNGNWVILDELNLAPTEVLEMLNRLLDDNRELVIPETQEVLKPHPRFMLFATQNPAGLYGGRRVLSRAFRNRFVEIHMGEIPEAELMNMLHQRCKVAPSRAELMVKTMKELQRRRQGSRIFAGKNGFITARDLFRWASRGSCTKTKQKMANEGYMLLAESLRNDEEKQVVREVIEKVTDQKVSPEAMYVSLSWEKDVAKTLVNFTEARGGAAASDKNDNNNNNNNNSASDGKNEFQGLVGTAGMCRLLRLVGRCLRFAEPVLLVGETGCGKTSSCQAFARALESQLVIVNLHANTETADLIGGFRPVRGKDAIVAKTREFVRQTLEILASRENNEDFAAIGDLLLTSIVGGAEEEEEEEGANGEGEEKNNKDDDVEMADGEKKKKTKKKAVSSLIDLPKENQHHSVMEWNTGCMSEDILNLLQRFEQYLTFIRHQLNKKRTKLQHEQDELRKEQEEVQKNQEEERRQQQQQQFSSKKNKKQQQQQQDVAMTDSSEFQVDPQFVAFCDAADKFSTFLETSMNRLQDSICECRALFTWVDGPLVRAMRDGSMILLDEISLAEDSVLERLNSVLETERTLVLAEKGGEKIVAHPNFRILATMNPGGDFGKKELSPALRNRFTEVWVDNTLSRQDVGAILRARAHPSYDTLGLIEATVDFWEWFAREASPTCKRNLSLRDLLAWVGFAKEQLIEAEKLSTVVEAEEEVGSSSKKSKKGKKKGAAAAAAAQPPQVQQHHRLDAFAAFEHGVEMILLDGLNIGTTTAFSTIRSVANKSRQFIRSQLAQLRPSLDKASIGAGVDKLFFSEDSSAASSTAHIDTVTGSFGIPPFFIDLGPLELIQPAWTLRAPTTRRNALRVLRAMQLHKPILLEGSPGVGKTGLITALAQASGHRLVRINLSDQTDMMDLLGTDLPTDDGSHFAWCDGVFLKALKNGDWVLLDELNLASQSVLEGLNACLDHRGEVFLPELNRTFVCPPSFRIFAAQNPLQQGGGRKGLPKSFLNRFSAVQIEELSALDLSIIAREMFPSINPEVLQSMIDFNNTVASAVNAGKICTAGRPWEFNLRDVFRWADLVQLHQSGDDQAHVERHAQLAQLVAPLLYNQRTRSQDDRAWLSAQLNRVFSKFASSNVSLLNGTVANSDPLVRFSPSHFQIGSAWMPRIPSSSEQQQGTSVVSSHASNIHLLPFQLSAAETLMTAMNSGWMCLLTGPSGSGKTTVARMVAAAAGQRLHEIALTQDTDTTELLGCFEQTELGRRRGTLVRCTEGLVSSINRLVTAVAVELLSRDAEAHIRILALTAALNAVHSTLVLQHDFCAKTGSTAKNADNMSGPVISPACAKLLRELLDKVAAILSGLNLEESILGLKSDENCAAIAQLVHELASTSRASVAGTFEWIDGVLVKALEVGEWLLMENVNLCHPTVLDRLNPLLEPRGELMLNERGLVDGEVRIIKPHKNFRLIMTMNPQHGEISRAMRNRGVEVCILPSAHQFAAREAHLLLRSVSGIPPLLAAQMVRVHTLLVARGLSGQRQLVRWGQTLVSLIARGVPDQRAFRAAAAVAYPNSHEIDAILQQQDAAAGGLISRQTGATTPALSFVNENMDDWEFFALPGGGFDGDNINNEKGDESGPISMLTSSDSWTCLRDASALRALLVKVLGAATAAAGTTTPASSISAEMDKLRTAVMFFCSQASFVDVVARIQMLRYWAAQISSGSFGSSQTSSSASSSKRARTAEASSASPSSSSVPADAPATTTTTTTNTSLVIANLVVALFKAASEGLEKWTQHDVFRSVWNARKSIENSSPAVAIRQLLHYLPVDLRFDSCANVAISKSVAADHAGDSMIHYLASLQAISWLTWTQYSTCYFADIRRGSTLHSSREHCSSQSSSVGVSHLQQWFWPLWESLLEAVESFVLDPEDEDENDGGDDSKKNATHRVDAKYYERLDEVQQSLLRLFDVVGRIEIPLDQFLILWRWVLKRLGTLRQSESNEEDKTNTKNRQGERALAAQLHSLLSSFPDLRAVVMKLHEYLPPNAYDPGALWTFGGHPEIIADSSLQTTVQGVARSERFWRVPWDSLISQTHHYHQQSQAEPTLSVKFPVGLLVADADLKITLTEVAAALLMQGRGNKNIADESVVIKLQEAPQYLESRISALFKECVEGGLDQQQQQQIDPAYTIDDSGVVEVPCRSLMGGAVSRAWGIGLWPVFDLRCACSEAGLLVRLLNVLTDKNCSLAGGSSSSNSSNLLLTDGSNGSISTRLTEFVETTQRRTSRPPSSLAPYQCMSWSSVKGKALFTVTCFEMIHRCLASFHTSLWKSTSTLPRFFVHVPLFSFQKSAAMQSLSSLQSSLLSGGMPAVQGGVESFVSAMILRTAARGGVAVAAREGTMRLLSEFADHLVKIESRDHVAQEWELLSSILFQLVSALALSIPRNDTDADADATASRGNCRAAFDALLNNSNKDSASAIAAIRHILEASEDSSILSVFDAHLAPALSLLAEHSQAQDKDGIQNILSKDGAANTKARGKVWLHIGCARLMLVAPIAPVDPRSKNRVKVELVVKDKEKILAQLEAYRIQAKLAPGSISSALLRQLELKIEHLTKREEKLRKNIVVRPELSSPSGGEASFAVFHSDVDKLLKGNANPVVLMKMADKILFGETERVWQANMATTIDRLTHNHSSFEDFVLPVVVALFEMRQGIRASSIANSALTVFNKRGSGAVQFDSVVSAASRLLQIPVQPFQRESEEVKDLVLNLSASIEHDPAVAHVSKDKRLGMETQSLVALLEAASLSAAAGGVAGGVQVMHVVMKELLGLWRAQKEDDERRAAEENASFKNRERSFGGPADAEAAEMGEDAWKIAFPTFAEDFADIVTEFDPLNNAAAGAPAETGKDKSKSSKKSTPWFSEEDGAAIFSCFARVVKAINNHLYPLPANVVVAASAAAAAAGAKSASSPLGNFSCPPTSSSLQRVYEKIFDVKASMIDAATHGSDSNMPLAISVPWHLDVVSAVSHLSMTLLARGKMSEKADEMIAATIPHETDTDLSSWHWFVGRNNSGSSSSDAAVEGQNYGQGVYDAPSVAGLDIYRDAFPAEAALLQEPVVGMMRRTMQLLEEFPEQPLLEQICAICRRLLSFPLDSPLARALTGVELLHTKGREWEKNAHRGVSLAESLEVLLKLVRRWRKLEADTWKALLRARCERRVQAAAGKWFPWLLSLFIEGVTRGETSATDVMSDDDDDEEAQSSATRQMSESEAFDAVESFIQAGNIADFEARLGAVATVEGTLQMFIQYGAIASQNGGRIRRILRHTVQYYSQFIPAVLQTEQSGRAQLQKDLMDTLILHKWDTRDFQQLQNTIDRNHKALHKLAAKYELLMETSVKEAFASANKMPQQVKTDTFSALMATTDFCRVYIPFAAAAANNTNAKLMMMVVPQSKPVNKTSATLVDFFQDFLIVANDVNDVAVTIISRVQELRESQLSNVKRRSFVDLLHFLKRCGLSTLAKSRPESQQRFASLFANASPTPGDAVIAECRLIELAEKMLSPEELVKLHQRQQQLRRKARLFKARQARLATTRRGATATKKNATAAALASAADAAVSEDDNILLATPIFPKSDRSYFSCVSKLQILRTAALGVVPDLQHRQVNISLALSEHFLHLLHQLRAALTAAPAAGVALRAAAKAMEKMASESDLVNDADACAHFQAAGDLVSSSLLVLSQLSFSLNSSMPLHPSSAKEGKQVVSAVQTALEAFSSELVQVLPQGENNSKNNLSILTAETQRSSDIVFYDAVPRHDIAIPHAYSVSDLENLVKGLTVLVDGFSTAIESLSEETRSTSLLVSEVDHSLVQIQKQFVSLRDSASASLDAVVAAASSNNKQQQQSGKQKKQKKQQQQQQQQGVDEAKEIIKLCRLAVSSLSPDLFSHALKEQEKKVERDEDDDSEEGNASGSEDEEEKQPSSVAANGETTNDDDNDDDDDRVGIAPAVFLLLKSLKGFDVEKILSLTTAVLAEGSVDKATAKNVQTVLEEVAESLDSMGACALALVRSCSKMAGILFALFIDLFQNGFCGAKEQAEDDGEGGGETFETDGTGLGEGKGKKNASDEITDESQIEGLKGEKQNEEESGEREENEAAVEMEDDFEGKLEKAETKDRKEDDEDDEDQEQDIDRKMGQFDEDDEENVLDERGEHEDGDEGEDEMPEEEKVEKDGQIKGEDKMDSEMRAKDEEDINNNDKNDNKQDEGKKEDEKGDDDKSKQNQDKGMNPEKGEEEGDDEDDDGDEEDNDDDQQPQGPERVEESHGIEVENQDEEMDLPDDLALEGGEEGGEDEQNMDENGEDEDGEGDDGENVDEMEDEETGVEKTEKEGIEKEGEENEEEKVEEFEQEGGEDEGGEGEVGGGEGLDNFDNDNGKPQPPPLVGDMGKAKKTNNQNEEQEGGGGEGEDAENSADGKGGGQEGVEMGKSGSDGEKVALKDLKNWENRWDNNAEEKMEKRKDNPLKMLGEEVKKALQKRIDILDPEEKKEGDKGEDKNAADKPDQENLPQADMDKEYQAVEDDEAADAEAMGLGGGVEKEEGDEEKDGKEGEKEGEEETAKEDMMDTGEDETLDKEDSKKDEKQPEEKQKKEEADEKKEKKPVAPRQKKKSMPSDVPAGAGDVGEEGEEEEKADEEFDAEQKRKAVVGAVQRDDEMQDVTEDPAVATEEEILSLETELLEARQNQGDLSKTSEKLWQSHENLTVHLSRELCEQLRLVLEPTMATKLQGDYRTGKRINLKKVIPYIASQFRRDQIWLRRTARVSRSYQILVCVDNSHSMSHHHASGFATQALVMLWKALAQLEVGEVGVVKFDHSVTLLHPLNEPLSDAAGARVLEQLAFDAQETATENSDFAGLLSMAQPYLQAARERSGWRSGEEALQLVIIISDGRILGEQQKKSVQQSVQNLVDNGMLPLFIMLDNAAEDDQRNSILQLQSVAFEGTKVVVTRYLDSFPFPYYLLVSNMHAIPHHLADAMRQWFEMVTHK